VTRVELPNKLYFKIGEAARLVGVKPYVLRYWETEFSILRPGKTPSRHRLYRRRDVELLLEIKKLLYQEGYTIAGAKKRLKDLHKDDAASRRSVSPTLYRDVLSRLKQDLVSLSRLLNGGDR